jgi:pectin methylesterase-like acyl-CoA thioesterase
MFAEVNNPDGAQCQSSQSIVSHWHLANGNFNYHHDGIHRSTSLNSSRQLHSSPSGSSWLIRCLSTVIIGGFVFTLAACGGGGNSSKPSAGTSGGTDSGSVPSIAVAPSPSTPPTFSTLGEEFVGPFSSWKSVKDYGAKGDGTTDDTSAIQTALNALKRNSAWTTLYFPKGNYRITAGLTTDRTKGDGNDYFGIQLIGEDALTTSIVYDGAAGGVMLRWDAWYDKVSRLTFDGKGKAKDGLLRAGGFATYGEISDMQFKDITERCINLGNGEQQGIAEQTIIRNRFYRCGAGITMWNYNSLDIYAWYNYFEDNDYGIYTSTGAFHAYENRFVRSKTADLKFGANQIGSIVNNISVGAKAFLVGDGNGYLQGNKIYGTVDMPLQAGDPLLLVDNMIQMPSSGTVFDGSSRLMAVGNTFIGSGTWPLRPAYKNYNRGLAAGAVTGHPITKAVDGDANSYAVLGMWADCGIQWVAPLGTRRTAVSYALTSSTNSERSNNDDPKDFSLLGSNDFGSTWTTLDTRTGELFSAQKQRKVYTIANPGNYGLYKLNITKNRGNAVPKDGGWMSLAEFELTDAANANLFADTSALVLGADETWGKAYITDQTTVGTGSQIIPSILSPWDFASKQTRTVIEPAAFTGAAVQDAINQAAALPAESRPVVHLKKGNYQVDATIVVPANVAMSIVGDGASESGSKLSFGNIANGNPILRLAGPSRATLRDFYIKGGAAGGVDGLVIDKADQAGGRIYGYQVLASGQGGSTQMVDTSFDINGIEQSDVNMIAFGMGDFKRGIKVTGGTLRAAGKPAPGRIDFLTGASANAYRNFDVTAGGILAVTAVWFEAGPGFEFKAPIIDLTAQSRGSLSMASMLISATIADASLPVIRTNDFAGYFTMLSSSVDHRKVSRLTFSGNGTNTRVFGALNTYPLYEDPNSGKPINQLWLDSTSPAGQIAQIASGDYDDYTNKALKARPTDAFIKEQLSLLRGIRTTPAMDMESGRTDVKLLRVSVAGGNDKTAIKINAN